MIYKDTLCPGCGRLMEENDDIVVCPECATPQHRECYEKENKCVNAHLHGESYEWKNENAPQKPSLFRKKEETQPDSDRSELSPCPNCGNMNPKGTKQCPRCGMKLVVFGIDLATEIKNQGDATPNENIPTYSAPFTFGEGEGFDEPQQENSEAPVEREAQAEAAPEAEGLPEDLQKDAAPSPEQLQSSIIGAIEQTGHSAYYDSYIDSVHVNLIANMVGPNAYKYIEKFKAIEAGKKVSFNWAAFFFPSYWFFYRKLYKVGIIIITLSILLSILITPYLLETSELLMEIGEQMAGISEDMLIDDAFFEQLIGTWFSAAAPMLIYSAANFIISLVSGFTANKLYKKYIINSSRLVMRARSKPEAGNLIARLGGTAPLAVLGAYLASQLLSTLASYLMF